MLMFNTPLTDAEEIDYIVYLNRVLPKEIRVLAWSAVEVDFSARLYFIVYLPHNRYYYNIPMKLLQI